MKLDRRDIAPLLVEYFPTMEKASSDEWHGFLNAYTGLDVSLVEENPSAFDKWRQALAEQGLPVWDVDVRREADIEYRGRVLLDMENKRVADLDSKLASLAKEAPEVSADDLMKATQP